MDEGCNFPTGSKGRVTRLFEEFDRFFDVSVEDGDIDCGGDVREALAHGLKGMAIGLAIS